MRISKNSWLINRPIAHRGLWGNGIVENTLAAYQNAIDNGYPIEIDVYCTKDGHPVVFHDKTLVRMTGQDGFIFDKTLDELKALKILGTTESIPTFNQVLELCENKTPLLIELKDQPDKSYVERVVKRLKEYKGEFAVQSFNPLIINKIRKLAPEFIRGILATNVAEEESKFTQYVVKNMPLNFLIKPDFISYYYGGIPLKKGKLKDKPLICWTVTDKEIYQKVKPYVNNIIFENFIP
ncbi:MAG: glycerophosphodiester phosphodiesterase [Clostridiales bacterium]|nr:glycerophosphodiester phosphodiesterase [Clostridiales bacterium]